MYALIRFYFQQMAIYSPVTAFLLLISSALVIDAAVYFRRNERIFGGSWQQICSLEPCGNVEAAGVRFTCHLTNYLTVYIIGYWRLCLSFRYSKFNVRKLKEKLM